MSVHEENFSSAAFGVHWLQGAVTCDDGSDGCHDQQEYLFDFAVVSQQILSSNLNSCWFHNACKGMYLAGHAGEGRVGREGGCPSSARLRRTPLLCTAKHCSNCASPPLQLTSWTSSVHQTSIGARPLSTGGGCCRSSSPAHMPGPEWSGVELLGW